MDLFIGLVAPFLYIYIYIYFPFSLFVSVYVYVSLCDFVCVGLLLPFVLGFSLFIFCFFVFFLFLFLLSCVVGRVLVLRLGVRPEPLRWEGRFQDLGQPETTLPHVISTGESSPRDLHLNIKTQLHPLPASSNAGRPMPNNQQDRNTTPPISREASRSHTNFTNTAKHTTRCSPAHHKEKIQLHPQEHRHQSLPPGSLHKPLNHLHPLGEDTNNDRNYERAASERRLQTH